MEEIKNKITVLSLFDGISCARVALERVGIKVDKYYASEIDKYAIQIAQKNYPDTIRVGDIKNLQFSNLPYGKIESVDLMIGGSPCQDLSIAKKNREGLKGCRSGLFYEFVRLLKEVKPKYFILENVNSMPKEAKAEITKQLWGIEPIMINAALVSAQNRKRLFWVGRYVGFLVIRGSKGIIEKYEEYGYEQVAIPQPEDKGILLKDILETGEVDREKSYAIDACYFKGANGEQYKAKGRRQLVIDSQGKEKIKSNTVRTSGRGSGISDKHNWDTIRIGQLGKGGQGDRIYSPEGKSVNLSANGGGRGEKTGLYLIQTPRGKNKGGKKALNGKTPTLSSSSWEHNNKLVDKGIVRKLTPTECERLQSLPDNYTEGVSSSQRYKMLGNGMNVEVIRHILSFIK